MEKLTTTGFICLEDDYKLVYKIAKIEYEEWEDGAFVYRFYPFYNVIDMLPDSLFQGIPGLDLSLKQAVYERKNISAVKPQLSFERLQKGLEAVQKVAPPVQPFREQRTR